MLERWFRACVTLNLTGSKSTQHCTSSCVSSLPYNVNQFSALALDLWKFVEWGKYFVIKKNYCILYFTRTHYTYLPLLELAVLSYWCLVVRVNTHFVFRTVRRDDPLYICIVCICIPVSSSWSKWCHHSAVNLHLNILFSYHQTVSIRFCLNKCLYFIGCVLCVCVLLDYPYSLLYS